jgi:calcineurin-like phosphoesterase family protein
MIPSLYKPFKKWADTGSIYILSDLHFDDEDCRLMDRNWISPHMQIERINSVVGKNDTFVCLGDVGKAEYVSSIKAGLKILLLGNHDKKRDYLDYFDEIYEGPIFISKKILLSHEPVYGLSWCLNIHGHDHNNIEKYAENCKHINLAANVCDYTPVSLGKLIKEGILSDIVDLHRMTINKAVERLCDNLDSTENDVGLMLDYLLSFCGNSKVLGLYKKVCRTFYEIYPACISDYIKYYLEEYDPEVLTENCEDYVDLSVVEKDNSK